MSRDRTTSATPVSHVFPGRRAMLWGHPRQPMLLIQHPDGTVGPLPAPRAPQAAPSAPDCVCAAYGALEARLSGIEERMDELQEHIMALDWEKERLTERLSALEADGLSDRGA